MPAFNEAASVGQVVEQIVTVAGSLDSGFELLVIDDGSNDSTAEVARASGAKVISHPYNRGLGAAVKTGVRAARGETVVLLDADGQHNPGDIPRLVACRSSYDMVVGARGGGGQSPLWRRPGKAFLGWLANFLTGRKIPDLNCGLRAVDRGLALKLLPILPDGFSCYTTLTIAVLKAGCTVGFVPIQLKSRVGKSTVRVSDGVNTLMLTLRIMSLFAPLRVFLPVSIVVFCFGLWLILESYILFDQSSIRGILAVLTSVLIFLFGLLADQIAALRRGERVE